MFRRSNSRPEAYSDLDQCEPLQRDFYKGTQMKRIVLFVVVLTITSITNAQKTEFVSSWTALTGEPSKPAHWLDTETRPVQTIFVTGHWVATNTKNPVAGFSVSEITCDKPGLWRKEGGCQEDGANVIPNLGFQVRPEHNEYEIVSWREDGMTARYVGGVCKIAHTLEVSFKTGSVLITDSPTTVNGKELMCPTESASYQLMDGETFTIARK
jgi:hypothetical protein